MLLLGLSRLPRIAFDPVLICPETGTLAAAAAERGIPVYPGPAVVARFTWNPILLIRYIVLLLSGLWGLRGTIRRLQPDIIHANTVRAGIASTLATAGMKVPIIWHNHDMLPSSHPVTLGIRFLIWASGRVRVVACSAAAANTLRPISRRQPQPTVIYNGCNVDRTKPDQPERAQKRAEIDVALGQFVIAKVGQITPRKGQLELIQAFSRVKTHIPHAVLVLCGSPLFDHDRGYLDRLHQETERLALIPRASEGCRRYRWGCRFVHPQFQQRAIRAHHCRGNGDRHARDCHRLWWTLRGHPSRHRRGDCPLR